MYSFYDVFVLKYNVSLIGGLQYPQLACVYDPVTTYVSRKK